MDTNIISLIFGIIWLCIIALAGAYLIYLCVIAESKKKESYKVLSDDEKHVIDKYRDLCQFDRNDFNPFKKKQK